MSGNERGKGMREEIQTFIHYMEEEKQASKNTMLSYQRDLLKMADYLEENGITECGKVTKTALNSYLLFQGKEGKAASTVSRSLIFPGKTNIFLHYIPILWQNQTDFSHLNPILDYFT